MADKLFYYSTNTYLSYHIAKTYYNGSFYVWCSPIYDPSKLEAFDPRKRIPASSSPCNIYNELKRDVESTDIHSSKIEANKIGLKKGALAKHEEGVIDEKELITINFMIDHAHIEDFRPILFIISHEKVKNKLEIVPVEERANPLSEEYRIKDLSITDFDLIQF